MFRKKEIDTPSAPSGPQSSEQLTASEIDVLKRLVAAIKLVKMGDLS
jgi:hypothetical protein